MKQIIKTLITAVLIFTPTLAQVKVTADSNKQNASSNQIEGKFIFHPNQDKIFKQDGYGAGVVLTTNLNQYLQLIQDFIIEKTLKGDVIESFSQRDITFQSTVRLYPIESYYSVKPFVQGGIRFNNRRFKASSIVQLPIDPGFLNTDQRNTFTSPFIGVGVNIKDYYIIDYSHLFPDFSSKVEFSQFGPSFFKQRGDTIQAKGFIPIGHKFLFTPAYRISRLRFEFFPYELDHQLSFGLSLKIK